MEQDKYGVMENLESPQAIPAQPVYREGDSVLGPLASTYRSHTVLLSLIVLAIIILLGYGTWALVRERHYNPAVMASTNDAQLEKQIVVIPGTNQVITIHSKLIVERGVAITGDLAVTGNGNFTGDVTADNITAKNIRGTFTGSFSGNGAGLTGVNARAITGSIADSQLSGRVTLQGNAFNGAGELVQLSDNGALPALNGSKLTGVNATSLNGQSPSYFTNASNLSSGTVADNRLSTNVAVLNGTNTFSGANTFTSGATVQGTISGQSAIFSNAVSALSLTQNGNVVCDASGNCSGVGGAISGAGTTNNLALFTSSGTIGNSIISQSGTSITVAGSFTATALQGDGSALTSVNATQLNSQPASYYQDATNLTAGTISASRLPATVVLTTANNSFSGTNDFTSTLSHNGNAVCDTTGNCSGVGGGVTTPGGTAGKLAKFTAGQTIADSLLSESGSTVTVGGTLAVNSIAPTAALLLGVTAQNVTVQGASVALTSTSGANTNTLNFAAPVGSSHTVTLPNASGTVAVSASGPLALDANGNLTCASCTVAGGAVDSLNSINGAVTVQGTANQVIVTNNGGTKTITLSTPQDINTTSNVTFGSVTVTNAVSAGSLSTGGTLAVTGAATAASYNGLSLTATANGFTVAGGTAVKTLTVTANVSLDQNLATTSSPSFAGLSTTGVLAVSAGTGIVGTFSGRVSGGDAVGNNEFATLGQVSGAVSGVAGNYIANNTSLQAGANFNISGNGTLGGSLSVASSTNLVGAVTLGTASTATGQLKLANAGSAFLATIQGAVLAQNTTYTLPASTGSADTICLVTLNNCVGSGASSIGAIDSQTPNANGAVIASNTLYLQSASASNPGLINTTTQTFAGAKTFNGGVTVAASQSIRLVGGITSTRPASPTAGMLYYDSTTNQMLQYNGSKWVSDRNTSTKIVAASNSSQATKDSADYVATGTGDQATINTALTAAAGGSVYLAEGTYTVSAAISIPNNTTLFGAGAGTLITIPNAQNGSYNLIENTDQSTGTRAFVHDLQIDGNKANQTSGSMNGIYFIGMGSGSGTSAVEGTKITNVIVRKVFGGKGIGFSGSSNGTITGNTVDGNSIGIYTTNSNYNTFAGNMTQGNSLYGIWLVNGGNSTITGNTVQANTSHGIYITSSNGNTIGGNTIFANGGQGVFVTSANNTTITGNTSSANNYGFYVSTSSNITITGNSALANNINGIILANSVYVTITGNSVQNNASTGIYLTTASNNTVGSNNLYNNGGATLNNSIYLDTTSTTNTITGNDITDTSCTTTCYAVNISDASSSANYLANNRFSTSSGTATINDAGTGTVYANQSNGANGAKLVTRTANDTAAFSVQNAAGSALLTVDSTNGKVIAAALDVTNAAVLNGTLSVASTSNLVGVVTLGTASTTSGQLKFYSATNTGSITLQGASTAGNYTLSVPGTIAANDTLCLQTLANCSGAGASSIGALDGGTANANGATITSNTLYLQSASASNPGLVNTTTQTLAGAKTFSSAATFSAGVTVAASQSISLVGGITSTRPASPTEGMLYYDTTTKQLLVYANGKWQADRSVATKIVADGSTSQNPEAADFVVPAAGTSAQTTINAAIAALPAAGGTIYLREGTYTVDGAITLPSNVTLIGAGAASRILAKASLAASINMITSTSTDHVTVSNLKLDGNSVNQGSFGAYGISMTLVGSGSGNTGKTGAKIMNVVVVETDRDGIQLANNRNSLISGSTVIHSGLGGYAGIYLNGSLYTTVTGNLVEGGGSQGIYLVGSTYNTLIGNTTQGGARPFNLALNDNYNVITGNTITGGSIGNLFLATSSNNSVTGNTISSSGGNDAFQLTSGASRNTISGNNFYDNGSSGATSTISIDGTSNANLLTGNTITDTAGTGYAISIASGSAGNYLSNNVYSGTGATSISDAGAGTIYANQLNASGDLILKSTSGKVGINTLTPTEALNVYNGNLQVDYGNIKFNQVTAPTAPTVAVNATAGNLTGPLYYVITFVTGTGETDAGTESASVNPTAQQVNLSAIPTGTSGVVTARKIYRGTLSGGPYKLVTTLADNTTTTYTDNISAGSLTTSATVTNSTGGLYVVNNSRLINISANSAVANTFVGLQSGSANTSGIYNSALGQGTLQSNTTGYANTATGYDSLFYNSTGIYNTGNGFFSLLNNTSGQRNSAVGYYSLGNNSTGSYNTAMGSFASYVNSTGSQNTASGYHSLFNNGTGSNNTVSGYQAGFGNGCVSLITCAISGETVSGYQAGYSLQAGSDYSTLIGYQAGFSTTTGGYNTNLGYQAGYSNLTGSGNVLIGKQAGYNELGSNKLYIANSNTATPLIGGDFSAGTATINGTLLVKTASNSATAFQVQDASAVAVLSVNTSTQTVTVKALVINVSLTVNGHIITGNSSGSTTAAAGANAGTGATAVITGNDTSGKIVITTGTGATAGDLADITFANAFGSAPNIVLTSGDANAAILQHYVSPTTTTFSINAPAGGAGLSSSTSYTFYYHVQQ
ncbi:MAG: right-handed parallel beta-helix repeat-containing protein [Patescibacteria group bacterium]|nr:right-handed parallel beta-helix repeat-containing protein [Patescibacteria group bacterium]